MQMDLLDFARNRPAEAATVEPTAWEEPGTTVWGRAWLVNVRRLCAAKYASELGFGEKVLRAGRLQ